MAKKWLNKVKWDDNGLVPVTVQEPSLYLSIPYAAEVESAAGTFRAKPPAYSTDRRDGLTAELVYVPAQISNSISNLFDKNQDEALSAAARLRGKIVISEGFSFPGKILEFEQKGAVGGGTECLVPPRRRAPRASSRKPAR